jgi:hypothetical protein
MILLAGFILSFPLSVLAKSDEQFPYRINKTVEKEKTYDYAFETIWETALILIGEMEGIRSSSLQEEGMKSVRSSVKSDKSSGIITFSLTHKGNKGYLTDEKSLFYYQVLLIKPLGEKRTRVYFHEINFYLYDRYVFHGKQLARYVDFTPSVINIMDKIYTRLKEKSLETQ